MDEEYRCNWCVCNNVIANLRLKINMGNKARNYTDKTLKRLFGLSGNICSFPGCNKVMVNRQNAKDSNICHIEAANVDGERYNENMTDEQRADYPNLILLCIQHHDETNDVYTYTVPVLQKMKQDHESSYLNSKLKSNPSMLRNTINAIAAIDIDTLDDPKNFRAIDPRNKIQYNNLKRNVAIINEYKVYRGKINTLYDELELQGSIRKEKLLSNIKRIYTTIKGKFVLDSPNIMQIVQEKADDIYDDVYDKLYEELEDEESWAEDIALGIQLIMVDAFIRCKILEEPN